MSKRQIITVKTIPTEPSRLSRMVQALRSSWTGPITSNSPEIAKIMGSRGPVSTGISVTEENALSYSAVWAAVSIISSQIGNLPLDLFKALPAGGKEKYFAHPLYRLLHDRPNPEMGSMVLRETLQAHVLTWGNAYAEIERDGADRPIGLWPLTPDRVRAVRDGAGSLFYRVSNPTGGEVFLPQMNTLHVPGLGFDGITGYGVIDKMRESIGLGLATERFGGSFFGNGATFGGAFEHPGRLTEAARKNFIEAINARHQGVDRAHRFMVVEEGMKYSKFGVDPDHAQFLETRTFQLDEVARWLNVPPHKLKNLLRSTNNNIEHQNLEYYIDCLSPWCKRWEQELWWKLVAPSERNLQSIKHNVDGLLRGDTAGRGEFHSKQFNTGSITPNEIRELEDRNPIDGGDVPFVPLNTIPLSLARAYFEAEIESKKASAEAARRPPPQPTDDPTAARQIEQLTEALALARRKAQEAEDAKDLANALLTERVADLQREQDAHAIRRGQHDGDVARLTADALRLGQDLATAVRDLTIAAERAQMVEADYQRVCGEKTTLTTERDDAVARAAEALRIEAEAHAATREAHQTDMDTLSAAVRTHEAAVVDIGTRLAAVTDQREALRSQTRDLTALQAQLTADVAARETTIAAVTSERDALAAVIATQEAVTAELRAQVATLAADRQAGVDDVVAVRVELARMELQRDDLATARRGIEETLATQAAALATLERRMAESAVAVRAAVVDRVAWLIDRESDRARRVQQSPEKLRKWVEQFYTDYGELCRSILRPSLRAWIVCTGHPEPIEHVLDLLIAQHIEQSVRQLRLVAEEHDAETLAPALEKLLRRWEADRAETIVTRVLQEAA